MSDYSIIPYLFFRGNCEEALEFYRTRVGAEVRGLMRYKESPDPAPPGILPPNYGDKIMHADMIIRGVHVMASDGAKESGGFDGFRLAMIVPTEADAREFFEGLVEGGSVQMPLTKTFWSPCFGMLIDRFGVGWMVMVSAQPAS